MKTQSELFVALCTEARTRFTKQVLTLTADDLKKKLHPSQNSIGFLIRHIGDVELLFAKNVFGASEVSVSAKTLIEQKDSGEWVNLEELKLYIENSFESLMAIVARQTDSDWEKEIVTKEFGTKTKAEAFGRIISHTAYHAGQMAIINLYGSAPNP